jgi:hypothetical protein
MGYCVTYIIPVTKPVGRPPKPKTKSFGMFISTRLTPGDYKTIHDAIGRSALSKCEWIRSALLEKAKRG